MTKYEDGQVPYDLCQRISDSLEGHGYQSALTGIE